MQNSRFALTVIIGVLWAATVWANPYRAHGRIEGGIDPRHDVAPVPQTGQVISYDYHNPKRDDGALQIGVELPIPRFTDKGDGTIKDNLTGLIWLKNANCIGTRYPSFDNEETPGDGMVSWHQALTFVAGINNGTYDCGDTSGKRRTHRTDWRLPNIRELFSLVDFAFWDPVISNAVGNARCTPIDCAFSNFPGNPSSPWNPFYWSSTSVAYSAAGGEASLAWNVNFFAGNTFAAYKYDFYFVIAVRDGH